MENENLQAIARTICKAICKEKFHGIQKNLSTQTVWIDFPVTGWTVLHHLAASQFLSIDNWQYVLDMGVQADRKGFLDKKTALGETVFDVFFRTRLDPLPWQPDAVRHAALQLRLALQHDTHCGAVPPDFLSDQHVVDVALFRAELLALCRSAFGGNDDNEDEVDDDNSLVTYLARIGATVPLEVFQWSLAGNGAGASRPHRSGLFPLHLLCQASLPSPTLSHDEYEPVFELFVRAYPEATTIACPCTGLLPLSMALQNGWLFRVVQSLVVPQAIHRAFVDAASAPDISPSDIAVRARKRFVGNEGMAITWVMAKNTVRERAIQASCQDEECARISNILDILLTSPGAIHVARNAPAD